MDIWSKICEFYSKISTLTDCCTMNGLNGLLYEEQTQMYDDEIWRARIHVLVFFFFLEYYLSNIISEREIWTLFDIPRYYWPILFIQNNTNSIIHQWNGISRAKRAYYFWKLCLYNDDRHSVIVRWRDLCKK